MNKLDDRVFIRFGSDADTYYTTSAFTGLQVFLEPMNVQHASFALERSQGYILNNGRYLHGQGAFQGKKVMGRVLITTDDTQHVGFTPRHSQRSPLLKERSKGFLWLCLGWLIHTTRRKDGGKQQRSYTIE